MKLYAKKSTAQKYLVDDQILCNRDITKYFIANSFNHFLKIIRKSETPTFFEFISDKIKVPVFFDIEIYKDRHLEEYNGHVNIIDTIKQFFKNYQMGSTSTTTFIILESHSDLKKSYHIIVRARDGKTEFLFDNVKQLKEFVTSHFKDLVDKKIIDTSVYREGLFRTIYSTKPNEIRPFIRSELSDPFNDVDSFVGNNLKESKEYPKYPVFLDHQLGADVLGDVREDVRDTGAVGAVDAVGVVVKDELIEPKQKDLTASNKKTIKVFLKKFYNYNDKSIREIFIDHNFNCIVIALDDRFCHNVDREHTSNNQYIIIDTISAKRKCHDTDCKEHKYNEVKMNEYPKELNELIKNVLKVNKQELELIDHAIKECKDYITENFDESIEEIKFDKKEMVFRGNASNGGIIKLMGKCRECLIEHQITNTGYCLKCIVCKSIFPKNQVIPVDDRYKNLNNFWMNYSQLVNNGTVNININNNYFMSEEEFNCDIRLDKKIFNNKELTRIYNQVLDGHKVIKISELISKLEIDFKYANGEWYYFNGKSSDGGGIWKMDKESLEFRKRIVNLSQHLNRIQTFYEKNADNNISLVKNIKSLINKLHKPGFEDEIIKGAKMYYNDEDFMKKLNSKKHLVPFTNGVFDLISGKFRETTKEDYINLTVGFPRSTEDNPEVHRFLREVLPSEGVRHYVLKKMSECLNGDIPNTYFLMFIGDTGANGKSQLLNLMKLAMGDFGEKVEVTLLTRKRNNANEANTEKIKLLNKRFAFLSEPEDGEKINIGLLKELTGSEEIVARGLYQDALSFVMEAKLFLACNELPEIKGEDTALWRRIRVIDFPSRFVDDPKDRHEYKIDRSLPSRMREDLSWRQTFMNILLEYYYKDTVEPDEVKIKTNEYRKENNNFYNWLDENIAYSEGDILQLSTLCEAFVGKKVSPRAMSKFRKELEKYIEQNTELKNKGVNHQMQDSSYNGQKYKGYLHLAIKY
jgi:P4 family phage/plasmid primase-like protien